MLTKVEITLQPPQDITIHPSMGSLFHGIIMQHIAPEKAHQLHQDGLRPYSQYLRYDKHKQQPIWCINALNQQAWEEIILPILRIDTVNLKHRNCDIKLGEKNIQQTTYQQLADTIFTETRPIDGIQIQLITPTTFKSKDQYAIYPEPRHIYHSLWRRWQTYSDTISLEENNIIDQLTDHTWIADYKLQMNKFHLEHQRIPAFSGSLRLALKGPDMLRRIAALLTQYANWSGIGIKTAIGMGAAQTQIYTIERK